MSVLKNKRHISRYEFFNNYAEFYKFSSEILSHTSNRRKKWICDEFQKQLNNTYSDIMIINNNLYAKSDAKKKEKENAIRRAINGCYLLNKYILIYCNITRRNYNQMCNWCNYLRKEISLLYAIIGIKNDGKNIISLDTQVIKECKFLFEMKKLHRFIHGKVVQVYDKFSESQSTMVINLIDDAFWNLMVANAKIPETKKEYQIRKKRLNIALNNLNSIETPLLAFFFIMNYKEEEMKKFAETIKNERKLISGLIKSDEKRFKNLK